MTSSAEPPAEREHLSKLFVGIVVVQILAVLGLYWLGVHFSR